MKFKAECPYCEYKMDGEMDVVVPTATNIHEPTSPDISFFAHAVECDECEGVFVVTIYLTIEQDILVTVDMDEVRATHDIM